MQASRKPYVETAPSNNLIFYSYDVYLQCVALITQMDTSELAFPDAWADYKVLTPFSRLSQTMGRKLFE